MDPTEPRRDTPVAGEPGSPEERHLYRLSSGMTLEEFHQWREVLMINPTMATNPLLAASGQQRIPLAPSPFEPPTVDRDLLPSTVAPTDPRRFCVPSQFGSSVLPNANMPSMMSNRVYSGWGILPPESLKAMARRNEMIQRQHTARMEMEMHAIYQQRRIEKVNPKGLAGLAIPFLYGSSISAGPATCHRRAMLPASDLHLHRRSLRNLHGNPMLVATGPHFLEGWGQKCPHLRRGTGNQKVLENDTESSKSQEEEKSLGEIHVIPYIEDEHAKGPEIEAQNNQKSREINKKPPAVLANACGELEPTHRKPWGTHDARMEAKAWDGGRQKVSEQCSAARGEKNGVYPPLPQPSLSGPHVLVPSGESLSLDEDIQKWTVSDVHDFICGLPGCSDYAQVFKDHAIDGETLPLLTEEHLRSTMGLKLGPALKIQLQVSQHVESMLYKKSFLLPTHTKQTFDQPADTSSPLDFNPWGDTLDSTCSQDIIIPKGTEKRQRHPPPPAVKSEGAEEKVKHKKQRNREADHKTPSLPQCSLPGLKHLPEEASRQPCREAHVMDLETDLLRAAKNHMRELEGVKP